MRFAIRLLLRTPGFMLLAAAVLALGIGAISAIFSVVDAALLRPLPYHDSSRLVMLWEQPPAGQHYRASPLNFQDWHDQNSVFAGMAAISGASRTLLTPGGAEQLIGQSVSWEYFDVLGIPPVLGRRFTENDSRTSADVVMISERLWRTRFGADPKLVGAALNFDGKPFTVVGVVPAQFQLLWQSDLWTVFTVKRSPEQRKMHYLAVVARVKPGLTIEQARAGMVPVAREIARIAPETNKDWGIEVEPLRDAVVGRELRVTSLALAGIVGFVLLMACANVANLMLARGAGRTREMAVRASLGAGTARLVRQLLTESMLLAAIGGAGGLALAAGLIRVAPALIPKDTLPPGILLALDARVAAFALAATLATALLFGLAPALQVARAPLADALRGGGRSATAASSRWLGGLATAEVALAVMLVAGAGLFLRTLEQLGKVDPGFHADRVLTMRLVLPINRYPAPARALAFFDATERELEATPGILSASFGGSLPLTGWDIGQGFEVGAQKGATHYQIVGARYFETLGIPLLAGRAFTSRDRSGAPEVAIVNREFARRFLQGRSPLGAHVRVQAMDMSGPKWVEREIVGVAGQVRVEGLSETENTVELYVPITQNPWYGASLAVRAAGDPGAMTSAVKAAIAKFDRDLAVTDVRTMDQIAYESSAGPRFRARLVAGFGVLALILSAVSVFGVLAFAVTQRTREFGIRIALGAEVRDVLRMVLGRGLRIALAGVAAGIAGAALLARSVAALLFGVRPLDPAAFGAAAGLLGLVAIFAAVIPALRAARVDPIVALRDE